jgi:DNA polymerase-3 subunit alpha
MTALLSVSRNDTAKVSLYCADCRRMGLPVLPPDLNTSGLDFSIEEIPNPKSPQPDYAIRFGMAAVKNVGEGAVEVMLKARARGGPFAALDDFAQRVDLRLVGKRALECLIKVGALDPFGARGQLLAGLDALLNASAAHFRAEEAGQITMFGAAGSASGFGGVQLPKVTVETTRKEMLAWEKELIGLYVSDHPLQPVMASLQQIVTHYSQELGEDHDGKQVVMAGIVTNVRPHQTKKGDAMGFVSVEDLQGHQELVLFPKVWRDVKNWLALEQVVVIRGKVDAKGSGSAKVLVDSLSRDFKVAAPRPAPPAPPVSSSLPDEPPLWLDDEVPPPDDEMNLPPARGGGSESVTRPSASISPAPAPVTAPPTAQQPSGGNGGAAPKPNGGNGHALRENAAPPAAAPSGPSPRPAAPAAEAARRVVVTIASSGDRDRDRRRMRRIHGLLTSYPGADRFEFLVNEDQRGVHLRFPNETTGYCAALDNQLTELLGPGAVEVQPL